MIFKVFPHKIVKEELNLVNEQEINISECEFIFDEEIPEEYVKEAYFTRNGNSYSQILVNNKCSIPSEVLDKKGIVEIGVVAYEVNGEDYIKRYNPSPVYITTLVGSLKDAENSEPITPTDKEQMEQAIKNITNQMNNLDIDASKVEHTTTITITKKDGTTKEVEVLDGEKGEKGDKGDAGSVHFIVAQELPTENIDLSAIYLIPSSEIGEHNIYNEYIYVNGEWEELGNVSIEVDLTDYVKNTDYATSNKGGVIRSASSYNFNVSAGGSPYANARSYSDYANDNIASFISKGTLENVIKGKDLTTKSYVDGLVGDIETILTTIDIGNGV